MAEGGRDPGLDEVKEQLRRESEARRLNKLFHGRYTEDILKQCIEDKGGFHDALTFLMTGDQETVRQYLQQSPDYVRSVRDDSRALAGLLNKDLTPTDRLFSCEECQRCWWKRVPAYKPVAKCYHCRTKYDPVPRDKEWGWGRFICECGREFKGFGVMGRTYSECHRTGCGEPVPVHEILAPKKTRGRGGRDSHDCNGVNCWRRNRFWRDFKPCECIHPKSGKIAPGYGTRIFYACTPHQSSGSSVDSFMTSGSLDSGRRSVAHTLPTVYEI